MTDTEKQKVKSWRMVFIGRPGSGKGTQVERIQKEFGSVLIPSPGNVYRDPAFRETPWGKIVGPMIDRGEFAPNEITNQVMKEKISELTREQIGFVSEGYPRTLGQAEFADQEIGIDWLINLNVPEDKIFERLSGRLVCPQCSSSYHLTLKPSKQNGICDICAIRLVQREDDKPEAVKNRLRVYYETAEPTIDYYRQKGKLIDIDGDQSIDYVYKEIIDKLLEKVK